MLALLLFACGDEPDESTLPPTLLIPPLVCETDDDCVTGEICEREECVVGDRDNSLGEALSIAMDFEEAGVFDPPGDVDFYVWNADGPTWIRIETVTDEEGAGADTVVRLLRESGSEIAQMDEYATGSVSTYDTVMYAFVPEAGTYYIVLEDASSFYGGDPDGGPDFTYTVNLTSFTSVVEEPDGPGDTIDIDVDERNVIWAVGVHMEEPGDVDIVEIDMAFDDTPIEVVGLANAGSSLTPHVTGASEDGTVYTVQPDLDNGSAILLHSVDGDHVLTVTDADGDGGDDAWTVLYVTTSESREPYEPESEPNDAPLTAQILVQEGLETGGGTDYHAFYAEGQFGIPGDVDHLNVTVEDDELLSVRCWAEVWGSEAGLQVAVLDLNGDDVTPSDQGTEPTDLDYYVYNAVLPEGAATLVLSDSTGGAGPSHFWRCAIFLTTFDVDF